MDGEIDLELYTLSIIRLNSALEKLENQDSINEIKKMFSKSAEDLNRLYEDIIKDLNQDEININEYYLFFQNGKQIFPQYIELLGDIDNEELDDEITSLITTFNNFNKISDAFPQNEMIKWIMI